VPFYAFSGGTLISFSANCVEMGTTSALSPVDVQIGNGSDDIFPLINFEKFVEFLEDSSKVLKLEGKEKSHFVTELMTFLIDDVSNPLELGGAYRLRSMTKIHSETLLSQYMFVNNSEKLKMIPRIINCFTKNAPIHNFEMDYNLVAEAGVNVKKMDRNIYKLSKDLINCCIDLKKRGLICPFTHYKSGMRMPFFTIRGGTNDE